MPYTVYILSNQVSIGYFVIEAFLIVKVDHRVCIFVFTQL